MSESPKEAVVEMLSDETADGPRFERVGTTEPGIGLYEMNSFDILVYMAGLKAMKERDRDE